MQATQEHAQDELTRLREERDDALKALQEAQLDAKDLEVREQGWKAAVRVYSSLLAAMYSLPVHHLQLDKSDLTVRHQLL